MRRGNRANIIMLWAVLGSLTVVAACGSAEQASSGTPGFTDRTETVDDAPFERAGPSNSSGSSTIPDAVFDPELIPPTLPPPPSTTTSTTLGELVDPNVAAVVDMCGFEDNVAPFQRLPFADPAEAERLMTSLVALMGRYAEVAPSVLTADLIAIRETLVSLTDLLRFVGFDASSPAYLEKADALTAEATSGATDSFGARLTRVVRAEKRLCI